MDKNDWVYLNGAFVRAGDAHISPFDRGFLFAQSAYEVTAVFGGKLIDFDGHMRRLSNTLAGLGIPEPMTAATWRTQHDALLTRNSVTEGLVYLQVTAGAYGARDFAGPETFEPGVFMFAVGRPLINDMARDGIAAITQADTRWARRDLKTTQLLSQALAYRMARDAGAVTAILHEDGIVTEAASANVWIVTADGQLMTRDLSPAILPGITRSAVLEAMRQQGIDVIEAAFDLETLRTAREVFTSSAGALIAPIVEIDGEAVGDGRPGPVTRQVQRLYYTRMGADLERDAPFL